MVKPIQDQANDIIYGLMTRNAAGMTQKVSDPIVRAAIARKSAKKLHLACIELQIALYHLNEAVDKLQDALPQQDHPNTPDHTS
jgi:hypothetical protein